MKRIDAAVIGIVSCVCLSADCAGAGTYKELRSQIIAGNLINGLYLEPQQAEYILKEAVAVTNARETVKKESAVYLARQVDAMRALKKETDPEQVPPAIAQEIHHTNHSLEMIRKQYYTVQRKAVYNVKEVLTGSQLYAIAHFKPCLIPPKSGARIGQSEINKGFIELVQKVYAMPPRAYQRNKSRLVGKFTDAVSLKYPRLSEEELFAVQEAFIVIIERARSLPEVDFDIQKKVIAREIKNCISPEKKEDVDARIARFLLSPDAVPALKEIVPQDEPAG